MASGGPTSRSRLPVGGALLVLVLMRAAAAQEPAGGGEGRAWGRVGVRRAEEPPFDQARDGEARGSGEAGAAGPRVHPRLLVSIRGSALARCSLKARECALCSGEPGLGSVLGGHTRWPLAVRPVPLQ